MRRRAHFVALAVVMASTLPAYAAYPTVAGMQATYRNSNNTNDVVDLPTPVSSGDLIIVSHQKDGSGSDTWPSPWVELTDTEGAGAASHGSTAYLIASGGETTVTVTSTNSERFNAVAIRISVSSWHGVTPPEASTPVTGSGTSPDPGSITASWGSADNLFVAVYGQDNATSSPGYPTNYTDNQIASEQGPSNAGTALATRNLTASSDDPGAFTIGSETWWATSIVVRPSGGGGPPPAQVIMISALRKAAEIQ